MPDNTTRRAGERIIMDPTPIKRARRKMIRRRMCNIIIKRSMGQNDLIIGSFDDLNQCAVVLSGFVQNPENMSRVKSINIEELFVQPDNPPSRGEKEHNPTTSGEKE